MSCELLEIDRRRCIDLLRAPTLFESHHDVELGADVGLVCGFVRDTIEDAALRTGGEARTVLFAIDAKTRALCIAATVMAERRRPFCAELLCLPLPQLRGAEEARLALATLLEHAAALPGVLEIATRLVARHIALELALRWQGFSAPTGNGADADGSWRVSLASAKRRRADA